MIDKVADRKDTFDIKNICLKNRSFMESNKNILIKVVSLNAIFMIVLLLSGCPGKPVFTETCSVKKDLSSNFQSVGRSKEIKANIYVDGTTSMEGFARPTINTTYRNAIETLESSILTEWRDREIKYYKFGTKIKEIDRVEFLNSILKGKSQKKNSKSRRKKSKSRQSRLKFYRDEKIFKLTKIDKVIEQDTTCKENSIAVIITDLFQTDSDLNAIADLMENKCLREKFAVAVAAFRSHFDGTVYDIGFYLNTPLNFSYKSNPDDLQTHRPFYMIFLGSYSDIKVLYDRVADKIPGGDKEFTIFYPSPPAGTQSIKDVEFKIVQGLRPYPVMRLKSSGCISKQYKLNTKPGSNAQLKMNMKYAFLPHITYANHDFKFSVESEKYNEQAKRFDVVDKLLDVIDAKFSYDSHNSILSINTYIMPDKIPWSGKFRFKVTFWQVSKGEQNNNSWWNSSYWDMDRDKINYWAKNKKDFDGSTTYNLSRFLEILKGATIKKEIKRDFNIFLYIEK